MKLKNVIKTILLIAVVFATVAATAQVERDPQRKGKKRDGAVKDKDASIERVKTKIENINKEMANLMITYNVNQMMKLYTTDAIILPNYNKKISGKTAIKKDMVDTQKSGMKFKDVKFITQSIERAGNYFYEIGEYQMTMVIPGAPQDITDIGKYLTIWEKKGKEFLIKVEMWNSNVNPVEKYMGGGEKPKDKLEKDKKN